ncbi:MAG: hypothetical protein Q7S31_02265 [bacterium]|nr:hypothetical protein [bacterium]
MERILPNGMAEEVMRRIGLEGRLRQIRYPQADGLTAAGSFSFPFHDPVVVREFGEVTMAEFPPELAKLINDSVADRLEELILYSLTPVDYTSVSPGDLDLI